MNIITFMSNFPLKPQKQKKDHILFTTFEYATNSLSKVLFSASIVTNDVKLKVGSCDTIWRIGPCKHFQGGLPTLVLRKKLKSEPIIGSLKTDRMYQP